MNWRKLLAWLGALGALVGLLLLLSGPPKPARDAIAVVHEPPPPPLPVGSSSNLYEWQSQEYTNRVLRRVETNAATTDSDRQALNIQNLIIRESGPGR